MVCVFDKDNIYNVDVNELFSRSEKKYIDFNDAFGIIVGKYEVATDIFTVMLVYSEETDTVTLEFISEDDNSYLIFDDDELYFATGEREKICNELKV